MNYALCIMNYFVSLHTDNLQKWIYEHNQTSLFDAGGDARCRHFPVWMRRKYQESLRYFNIRAVFRGSSFCVSSATSVLASFFKNTKKNGFSFGSLLTYS